MQDSLPGAGFRERGGGIPILETSKGEPSKKLTFLADMSVKALSLKASPLGLFEHNEKKLYFALLHIQILVFLKTLFQKLKKPCSNNKNLNFLSGQKLPPPP